MREKTRVRFCYVAQGRAQEIDRLKEILSTRNFVSLTWDEPREGSIFFPKSSWSAGRRKLCHEALKSFAHEYIIFMDGDAITTPFELDAFEQIVGELKPAVAVPRVPKTEHFTKKLGTRPPRWVLAYDSDEQFQCFDSRVLQHHLGGSPYVSDYDEVSWWYPCVLNQKLIRKHYWRSFIQVNLTCVSNDSHGQYPNTFDPDYIHKEADRLGIGGLLPLTAGGRFSARPKLAKRFISIDKRIFLLLSHLSSWLYKPFDPFAPAPQLSDELKSMIR